MDFELEMAFFIGPGNELGDVVRIEDAEDRIFGVVVMNDWSGKPIPFLFHFDFGSEGYSSMGSTEKL